MELPPIRCTTCGAVLGNKYVKFLKLLDKGVDKEEAYKQVGIGARRYCCKGDLLNPQVFADLNEYDEEGLLPEIKELYIQPPRTITPLLGLSPIGIGLGKITAINPGFESQIPALIASQLNLPALSFPKDFGLPSPITTPSRALLPPSASPLPQMTRQIQLSSPSKTLLPVIPVVSLQARLSQQAPLPEPNEDEWNKEGWITRDPDLDDEDIELPKGNLKGTVIRVNKPGTMDRIYLAR